MDPIIIDNIKFQPNYDQAAQDLKIKGGSSGEKELQRLIKEASAIANPKAVYKLAYIEKDNPDLVYIDGNPFKSRLLCRNLDGINRVFPYIATCGLELNEWKASISDLFLGFMADVITSMALNAAINGLFTHLKHQYGLKKTATMNPGSLNEWPLTAQTELFSLLGNPKETIGVYLTDSLLMVPRQSVSGILFETDTEYVNCMLCPREACPSRRAKFDSTLRDEYLS